jgi:hypothetical protein
MKTPGLEDLNERGDEMQATLNRIEALLVQIEINTRPRLISDPLQVFGGPGITS